MIVSSDQATHANIKRKMVELQIGVRVLHVVGNRSKANTANITIDVFDAASLSGNKNKHKHANTVWTLSPIGSRSYPYDISF